MQKRAGANENCERITRKSMVEHGANTMRQKEFLYDAHRETRWLAVIIVIHTTDL